MKIKVGFLFTLFLLAIPQINAQDKRSFFLGLQPALTKEKHYTDDEFDLNILPLVFQMPLNHHIDIRYVNLINRHFGPNQGWSDFGGQVLFPVFFRKKENPFSRSHGFYIAPLSGFGYNKINDHYTYIAAVEPGYMFKADKWFTLTIGVQYGASWFNYRAVRLATKRVEHFGIKVNLGGWVR